MTPLCTVCGSKTDAFACKSCASKLAAWFGDLPALLGHLEESVARQTKVDRVPVTYNLQPDWSEETARLPARLRSPHAYSTLIATTLPVDLNAAALLGEVRTGLVAIVRDMCESRDLDIAKELA